MAWRNKMNKMQQKQKINWISGPCELHVVSGSDHPFGIGFVGNPPDINQSLHLRLKKVRSPSDGSTYWSNWLPEEPDGTGGYWAHLKSRHDPGFCSLSDFLNSSDFVEIWNDAALVKNVTFHKGRLTGPVISEAEAIRLNELFDPDVELAIAVDVASSSSDPPATESAPKRRRVFGRTSCTLPVRQRPMEPCRTAIVSVSLRGYSRATNSLSPACLDIGKGSRRGTTSSRSSRRSWSSHSQSLSTEWTFPCRERTGRAKTTCGDLHLIA